MSGTPNKEEIIPRDLYGFTVEQLLDFVYHTLSNQDVDIRVMRNNHTLGYSVAVSFVLNTGTTVAIKKVDINLRKTLHAVVDEVLRLK
jgi:hypothetical protein